MQLEVFPVIVIWNLLATPLQEQGSRFYDKEKIFCNILVQNVWLQNNVDEALRKHSLKAAKKDSLHKFSRVAKHKLDFSFKRFLSVGCKVDMSSDSLGVWSHA